MMMTTSLNTAAGDDNYNDDDNEVIDTLLMTLFPTEMKCTWQNSNHTFVPGDDGDLTTDNGKKIETLGLCQKKCEFTDTCVAVNFDPYKTESCRWDDSIPSEKNHIYENQFAKSSTLSIKTCTTLEKGKENWWY